MTEGMVLDLARNGATLALQLTLPILGFSLAAGLLVSLFQAVTQINEATLSFVPKLVAVAVAALVFGPWMLNSLLVYTSNLFISLPSLAH